MAASLENNNSSSSLGEEFNFNSSSSEDDFDFNSGSSEEEFVVNITHDNNEELSEWLREYPPSRLHDRPDIKWLRMEPEDFLSKIKPVSYGNVDKDWEELKLSKQPINFSSLSRLAKKHNYVRGMWLFFVKTGCKVDLLWQKVATQFKHGVLSELVLVLRVSQTNEEGRHVVVLNHADFTNEKSVFALEKALRDTGIKCELKYKPEIYTHLGIYAKNEYGIKPTIYASNYDVLRKTSKITRVF